MQSSLQAIANKARRSKQHRFRNLYGMLNQMNLEDSFARMNRRAAPGVDRESFRDYDANLAANIGDLVNRLKRKRYRTKLIRRVYIPKANGKERPLGLPALEDKLVQVCATRILEAIYEQDFLSCSYGYRPHSGPREASRDLANDLGPGQYRWIVEADIKGFFDSIDHDWLLRMLEQRVDDQAFLGLIRKWLKAGVLEVDGRVSRPTAGTPQGGVISPVLANVYLHYVLDLWFQKVVRRYCAGAAYLIRYADDFVCAFEHERDARRFYAALGKRFERFGLQLAKEKSRVTSFERPGYRAKYRYGRESFVFLGFEYRWGRTRSGYWWVKRRTAPKRLHASIQNVKRWIKTHRHFRMRKFFSLLNSRLRGYYNYYGIRGNLQSLASFYYQVELSLYKWLNRRSQRRSLNWQGLKDLIAHYEIEKPRVTERPDRQLMLTAN